jgi:hypothetical protein
METFCGELRIVTPARAFASATAIPEELRLAAPVIAVELLLAPPPLPTS